MSIFNWIARFKHSQKSSGTVLSSPQEYSGLLEKTLHDKASSMSEAENRFYQLWLSNPESFEGMLSAASLSLWTEHPQWAHDFLTRCLASDPNSPQANGRLGLCEAMVGDWISAVKYLAKGVDVAPHNAQLSANLGVALYKMGEGADAQEVLSKAWDMKPQSNPLAGNLFFVALHEGDFPLARRVVESALARTPEAISQQDLDEAGGDLNLIRLPPDTWPILAAAKLAAHTGKFSEAENYYRQFATRLPSLSHSGMGTLAMAKGDFVAAFREFSDAIDKAIAPNEQYFLNRALSLVALRRYDEALCDFDHALEQRPQFHEARLERGTMRLRKGEWQEGWRDYEARLDWRPEAQLSYFDPSAIWRGEPLTNKTIIMVGEQGQGDVIQFVRFVWELAEQDATAIVFSQPSLVRLIRGVPGVSGVFTYGEPIPAYDYWIPVVSLPFRLGITLESILWRGPYVTREESSLPDWEARLGRERRLKVGLVWSGGDYRDEVWDLVFRRRNIPLRLLIPLLEIPGISFFSLQKGKASEQIAECTMRDRVADFSSEWSDFRDTANFIAHMDLVITVDTAVAHLAGAMEIPVWILSRTDGCWRWLDRREDSPWYPSARVFHQGIGESWEAVIDRVATSLRTFVISSGIHHE